MLWSILVGMLCALGGVVVGAMYPQPVLAAVAAVRAKWAALRAKSAAPPPPMPPAPPTA